MNVKAFVEKRKWTVMISFCLFLNLAIATTIRVRNLPLLEGKYLLETDAYRFLRQAKLHFAAKKPLLIESKLEFGGKSYPRKTCSIRELSIELEKQKDGSVQPQTAMVVAEVNGKGVKLPPSKVYYHGRSTIAQGESFPGAIYLTSEEIKSEHGSKTFWEALYIPPVAERFLLVHLYLLEQNAETFQLVYPKSEDAQVGVGVLAGRGPVKIWEIKYLEQIQANPQDLETEFPNPNVYRLKPSKMVAKKE